MTKHLSPTHVKEHDSLRNLSRSPKPYHHENSDLPYASDRFLVRNGDNGAARTRLYPDAAQRVTDSSPASESGTEADDEHFLKGLPAPRSRLHKGLRGYDDPISGTSTPITSPTEGTQDGAAHGKRSTSPKRKAEGQGAIAALRQNKNFVQRATEAGIVVSLGLMVRANEQVKPLVSVWDADYKLMGLVYGTLLALYPLRVVVWEHRRGAPSNPLPLRVPPNFDPAPILYPPAITTCASLLIAAENQAVLLPNIILSICSWPQQIVPRFETQTPYDSIHWALSCIPLAWGSRAVSNFALISEEDMTLLYPLHQTLCVVLHHLTTTSLLTAELQLFSVALINVLLLASSPQMQILKVLLWVGGLSVLVLCSSVIRSAIVLARVPKWRFRKIPNQNKNSISLFIELFKMLSWRRIKSEALGSSLEATMDYGLSDDGSETYAFKAPKRVQTLGPDLDKASGTGDQESSASNVREFQSEGLARRHTLSYAEPPANPWQTPSGRRKRGVSLSLRPFLKLTHTQAVIRKWLYATYVYNVLAAVIFIAVRTYIQKLALHGLEPIGFALAYLFGDIPWFRFQVVGANLEGWIPLPPRSEKECHLGWVQHLRHDDFGEANTRLLVAAYWFCVFTIGLVTVFRLKEIYEVDTRRKVFHFMMVGILLPPTFIDPTFCALALSLVLAIFLILDLLRASQLPPLSKPIASFLAPYVDGRDFRGPVVISHIFLLIGCAIPLWLALAALPRSASDYLPGWEVPARDVSMVSGVICVGLGDAAASLIGRRYGHRKWLWGGGKSLEGSLAFAVAVFFGLAAASAWMRVGGWPIAGDHVGVVASARNAAVCGSLASLTEAVLTGGNDNVIVPVVLWTCVKSLAI